MAKVDEVARFEDKYGDERIIHKTRHGLQVKREVLTPALRMNQSVSAMIGARIRKVRLERGWKLEELALRAGMGSGNPKDRIWAIENATRQQGMRMGTVYAIAYALGVEATALMPSVREVAEAAEVSHTDFVPPVRSLR